MPTNHNPSLFTLCDEFSSFLYRLKAFACVLKCLYEQGCSQDESSGFSLMFDDLVECFSEFSKKLDTLSKGGKAV